MLAWRPIGQVISKVWYIEICKPLFAWKPANLKAGQMFSWPMGGLFHLARGAPASPRRLNPRSILLHLPVLHHDRVTMEEQWKYFFGWKYWFYTNCNAWSNLLPTKVRVTHRYSIILKAKRAFTKMWVLGGMCYWVTQSSIEIRKYLRFSCSSLVPCPEML